MTPPTVAMSVLAGSGPSATAVGRSTRLAWPSTVPGRTRAASPPSSTSTPREVPADVDQDPVALALAVQARAAAAEGHRDPLLAAEGEHLRDVVGVARLHDRLREQPVGARVGGVADQVDRRGSSTRSAPSSDSSCERSGCGVPAATQSGARSGVRVGRLRGDPLDVWLEQRHEPRWMLEERHPGRDPDLDQLGLARTRSRRAARSAARRGRPTAASLRRRSRRRSPPCQSRAGRGRARRSTPRSSANHLRIAYSLLRRTRNVTGTL